MPTIKLQAMHGDPIEVDGDILWCSGTIKTMLDGLGKEEDDNKVKVIRLDNVTKVILLKVVDWMKYHKTDPQPVEDDDNEEERTFEISPWDVEFASVHRGNLFELMLAAKYLDIKGLLHVTCNAVVGMIKGKTPEEIRAVFGIENDFSRAEEEEVRKENEGYDGN